MNIPVIVRDDTGAQIATDTLNLVANGHLAFTLATDKYPGTANIRGTIEFDTPAGTQIGALGIRIPVAHTFTTLPGADEINLASKLAWRWPISSIIGNECIAAPHYLAGRLR